MLKKYLSVLWLYYFQITNCMPKVKNIDIWRDDYKNIEHSYLNCNESIISNDVKYLNESDISRYPRGEF